MSESTAQRAPDASHASATPQALDIVRASGSVGAEIRGLDVRRLNDAEFGAVRQAHAEHGVIFIRDQDLTPEDHIAFAKRWGPINVNRFFKPVEGYPEIAEVLKEPEQQINIGGAWHTDHSYDQVPALGSILYAREVPSRGGDTLFASMGAAFEALSPGFQSMLEGLTAQHSSRHVFGAKAIAKREVGDRFGNADLATQDVEHPVVIRHPVTGRRCLYVNPGFTRHIVGWSEAESNNLLAFLYEHARQPQFQTRFHWQVGSLAVWDNRSTWHFAMNDYAGERRHMHRITIEGVPLT
ncbi:MAG: TauD/TfdA family dioxygenase [Pseudomonadota bacterium]